MAPSMLPDWTRADRRRLTLWASRHLKPARDAADFSQADVFRKTNVSIRRLSDLERRGAAGMPLEKMPAMQVSVLAELVAWISSVLGYGADRCQATPCRICLGPEKPTKDRSAPLTPAARRSSAKKP